MRPHCKCAVVLLAYRPDMDKTLQTICGMLQSPDGMRRCAAAMVIAELRPKQDVVIKALGATLKDANQLLTRYVLEAFEALDSRAVVPYVLPLLEAPETGRRQCRQPPRSIFQGQPATEARAD